MLRDHGCGAISLHGVSVNAPSFTKLYCLVTEAHGCEQLAQGCYSIVQQPWLELATIKSLV